jgi:hypothetical protein
MFFRLLAEAIPYIKMAYYKFFFAKHLGVTTKSRTFVALTLNEAREK